MELKLPDSVGSKRDIIRMQRMIETYLDGALQQRVALEKANVMRQETMLPKEVDELMQFNQLEVNEQNLKTVYDQLSTIKEKAKTVRVSFASEPSEEVFRKIVGWFRREIDSAVLIQIGVQPSIAGGVVVHTGPNRYDFSLRSQLLGSVPKFLEVMRRVQ